MFFILLSLDCLSFVKRALVNSSALFVYMKFQINLLDPIGLTNLQFVKIVGYCFTIIGLANLGGSRSDLAIFSLLNVFFRCYTVLSFYDILLS